jgi:hypothetical protein
MMVCAVPVLAVFVWWQRYKARTDGSPLVEPSLFKSRSFTVGLLINLLFYAAVLCFALTFSMLLQLGHGFSAIHTVLTALFITVGVMFAVAVLLKKVIPALGRYSLTVGAILGVDVDAAAPAVADHVAAHHRAADLAPLDLQPALADGHSQEVSGLGLRECQVRHPARRRAGHQDARVRRPDLDLRDRAVTNDLQRLVDVQRLLVDPRPHQDPVPGTRCPDGRAHAREMATLCIHHMRRRIGHHVHQPSCDPPEPG